MNTTKNKTRIKGLKPLKEYPTYQAALQLHPQNELTAEGLYIKAVLYVIDWLKHKLKKEGADTSFLNKFSDPSQYMSINNEDIPEITAEDSQSINAVHNPEDSTWAVRIVEPAGDVPARMFITVLTVTKGEGSVLVAAKTTCQEPVNTVQSKANVYRLSCISHDFSGDADILMTECDIPSKYSLIEGIIDVNGKSNAECDDIFENLIANPNRQYPIALMTKELYDKLAEQEGKLNKLLYSGKYVSYVIVVHDSVSKLAITRINNERMSNDLSTDRKCILIPDGSKGDSYRQYELFDEDDELKNPNYNTLIHDLQNNTREKAFDYHNIPLFSEARILKSLGEVNSDAASRPSAEITSLIEEQQEEINIKDNTIDELRKTIELLENEKYTIEKRNKELARDNLQIEKYKQELYDKNEVIRAAEERESELSERISQHGNEMLEYRRRLTPLLDPPVTDASAFLKWVNEKYSDLIIVHKRAESELLSEKSFNDYSLLARMIHYLYGYTLCTNMFPGDYDSAVDRAKDYDVLEESLEATNVGDACIHHKKEYSIDISGYDSEETTVILNKHIKKGNQNENLIRLYFYYDSRIGKTIIGSMPGHLPTDYR